MVQAVLIDGRQIAELKRQRLKLQIDQIFQSYNISPALHVILIGNNPASKIYVRNKQQACVEVGISSQVHFFPENVNEEEIKNFISELNKDFSVHGILLQLPLPSHLNSQLLLNEISPVKDVDGLHSYNLGRLLRGDPLLIPCTPKGCLELILSVCPNLTGKNVVVIGRSTLVGKPLACLLTNANATVTIAHSYTHDLAEVCRQADILVVAIGKPAFINKGFIKPGAIVIDVGINPYTLPDKKNSLVGDVDFKSAQEVAEYITPVPGGVGPMTVSCLLENTVQAFLNQLVC